MTDQPKWTPGPWQMETVRTSCGTCHRIGPFPRPNYASKSEGWACVYDDYPPGVGSPDLLANAHLIAAAPDMYAALANLIARYDEVVTTPDCSCSQDDHDVMKARSALSKARGGA